MHNCIQWRETLILGASLPKKENESETALGAESLWALLIQILIVIQEPKASPHRPHNSARSCLSRLQKCRNGSWKQPPSPSPTERFHILCLCIKNRMINVDGGDAFKRIPETQGCYLTASVSKMFFTHLKALSPRHAPGGAATEDGQDDKLK